MPYSSQIDEKQNLLSVSYDESTSYEDRLQLLDEILKMLIEKPALKVLLDIRGAVKVLSEDQQMHFGSLIASNKKALSHSKIAIVIKCKNPHGYIQAQAYFNGVSNMVEFDDESSALAWLAGEFI